MEKQKSFIIKPIKLFVFSLTISFSIFFFFVYSFIVFNHTASLTVTNETILQFSEGFSGIKAQVLVALPRDLHQNVTEGSIFNETRVEKGGVLNKNEILGDTQMRESDYSYGKILSSLNKSEVAISNRIQVHIENHEEFESNGLNGSSQLKNIEAKDPNLRNVREIQIGSNEDLEKKSVVQKVIVHERGSGTKEKIEKKGLCDVSVGRWVYDESYPLYTNNSCSFIDEGFACESNGRLDKNYMKYRWMPSQCNMPRFDPMKMLESIRGKRLVFVGDSINRNQWESMICMLRRAISDPTRVYEARGRRITKERGSYNFKFVDYQCSVEYYLTHFLVHESKARVGSKRLKTLKIDAIDRGSSRWRGADILVFNTAHWWSHYKTKAGVNYFQEGNQVHPKLNVNIAYNRALTTWASWVDRYINPSKTQVFFRSSSPSHFSGGEWNAGGHCKESSRPLNHTNFPNIPEKNMIIEDVVKQMKTPVTILNITNMSGLRMDGHPSIYGTKPAKGSPSNVQDCSHWCLPGVPDAWNEILYYHLLPDEKNVSTN